MLLKALKMKRQSSVRHGGTSRLGAPGHQQTFEGFIGCPADTSTDRFVKLQPYSCVPLIHSVRSLPRLLNRIILIEYYRARSVDMSIGLVMTQRDVTKARTY